MMREGSNSVRILGGSFSRGGGGGGFCKKKKNMISITNQKKKRRKFCWGPLVNNTPFSFSLATASGYLIFIK